MVNQFEEQKQTLWMITLVGTFFLESHSKNGRVLPIFFWSVQKQTDPNHLFSAKIIDLKI